jgi:hypothetical protein
MALQPGCTAKEPRYNGNIQSEVRLSAVLTRSRLEAHLTTFVDGYINADLAADTIQEPKVRFTNDGTAPMIVRFTVGALHAFELCRVRHVISTQRIIRHGFIASDKPMVVLDSFGVRFYYKIKPVCHTLDKSGAKAFGL